MTTIEELLSKIVALEERINELELKVEDAGDKLDNLDWSRVDSLESDKDDLERKIDNLESTTDDLDKRINDVEGSLEDEESKSDTLESEIGELKEEVRKLDWIKNVTQTGNLKEKNIETSNETLKFGP